MKTKTGKSIAPNAAQQRWSSTGKPPRVTGFAETTSRHCATSTPRGYPCPELQPLPGITPDRFAAFALPSRIGNRLHYPDGRVEVLA